MMEVQTTDQLLQLEFNEELLSKVSAPLIKRFAGTSRTSIA